MQEGKRRADWDHTAATLWITATVNSDPKKRKPQIEDFHPYSAKRRSSSPWEIHEAVQAAK